MRQSRGSQTAAYTQWVGVLRPSHAATPPPFASTRVWPLTHSHSHSHAHHHSPLSLTPSPSMHPRTLSLTHSLIHARTHSLTHSLTHARTVFWTAALVRCSTWGPVGWGKGREEERAACFFARLDELVHSCVERGGAEKIKRRRKKFN